MLKAEQENMIATPSDNSAKSDKVENDNKESQSLDFLNQSQNSTTQDLVEEDSVSAAEVAGANSSATQAPQLNQVNVDKTVESSKNNSKTQEVDLSQQKNEKQEKPTKPEPEVSGVNSTTPYRDTVCNGDANDTLAQKPVTPTTGNSTTKEIPYKDTICNGDANDTLAEVASSSSATEASKADAESAKSVASLLAQQTRVLDRQFDSAADAFKQEMNSFSSSLNKEHYTNALMQINKIKKLQKENKNYRIPKMNASVVQAFRKGFAFPQITKNQVAKHQLGVLQGFQNKFNANKIKPDQFITKVKGVAQVIESNFGSQWTNPIGNEDDNTNTSSDDQEENTTEESVVEELSQKKLHSGVVQKMEEFEMDKDLMKIVESSMRTINFSQENYAQIKDQNDVELTELANIQDQTIDESTIIQNIDDAMVKTIEE